MECGHLYHTRCLEEYAETSQIPVHTCCAYRDCQRKIQSGHYDRLAATIQVGGAGAPLATAGEGASSATPGEGVSPATLGEGAPAATAGEIDLAETPNTSPAIPPANPQGPISK